jgi:hypothetical protein
MIFGGALIELGGDASAGFARREHSFRRDVNTGERARFGAM